MPALHHVKCLVHRYVAARVQHRAALCQFGGLIEGIGADDRVAGGHCSIHSIRHAAIGCDAFRRGRKGVATVDDGRAELTVL